MRATVSHPYEWTKYRDENWPFHSQLCSNYTFQYFIGTIPNGFRMKSLYKFCETLRERERERENCFMALISLQQWKHFIAIRAFSDLASGGIADSTEAHTYHYGRNAKLSMKKLFW